jgi:pyruvate formate lyase activating enzyme
MKRGPTAEGGKPRPPSPGASGPREPHLAAFATAQHGSLAEPARTKQDAGPCSPLRIGGYLPASFSDYPGRLAAVIFTQGCNFRCPWCHNPGLLDPQGPALYNCEEIIGRLAARKGRIGGVVISGGEPTLQPDLLPFCRRLRDLGLAVKLDTNGSRPAVLAQALTAGVVDYIAMDLKAPWEKYPQLAGVAIDPALIRRSMEMIAASGIAHHFRTTAVTDLLSPADLAAIRELVPAGSSYKVQPFRQVSPSA